MKDLLGCGGAKSSLKCFMRRVLVIKNISKTPKAERKQPLNKNLLAGRAQQEGDLHHFSLFLCVISLKICDSADQRNS